MTHLRIKQNNGVIEEISAKLITKLYEIAHAGLDVSSELQGRLHSALGYRYEVEYLTQQYPGLYINVDNYAIPFEDPKMVAYLNSIGVGSDGYVTEAQAAAATIVANSANTEVTKFNELRYFTNITQSRGGWTGGASGDTRFYNWTALEEVDISNFTSLGHVNGYAWDDTFCSCTSLKKVTASDKLVQIGYNAFNRCSNLEQITGLNGVIEISNLVFNECSKLQQSSIQNCIFKFAYQGETLRGNQAFCRTKFTTINLSIENTEIPATCFYECTELSTITGTSNIEKINGEAFRNCSKLTSIDLSSLKTLGNFAFYGANLTGSLSLPNLEAFSGDHCFGNNKNLTSVTVDPNKFPTSIPRSTFEGCTSLTTITGLSNVTQLGLGCFNYCSNLETIDIDWSKITKMATGTCLQGCSKISSLVTVNIPNLEQTENVDNQWFRDCSQIQHVVNLGKIEVIGGHFGQGTFDHCTNLLDVTLPETVTRIKLAGLSACPNVRWVKLLSTSLPTYDTVNAWDSEQSYGRFFGENFQNSNINQTYTGATYPIYVRDDLYQQYIVAPKWSLIAFRIKPMSQFATDFPNG